MIGAELDISKELLSLVDATLNLDGRSAAFVDSTPLLGAVPELDSMGVVALITALEERFGLSIDDDEIDGSVFQTWGTLLAFVRGKLGG
jgi:acyl carrier protein